MSQERAARLQQFNESRGGSFSSFDLELIAYFEISSKSVADHVIWDDREAVLANFDELVRVAAGEESKSLDSSGSPSPSVRYARLRQWRDGHASQKVRQVPDADLGRLAAAPIGSALELGRAAATLGAGGSLIGYADELLEVLGIQQPSPKQSTDEYPINQSRQAEQVGAEPSSQQPAPQFVPQPAPMPEPDQPDPSKPFEWVQVLKFKNYDWNQGQAEPVGHLVAVKQGDQVQMEWTAPESEAKVTLYRIVTSQDSWPTGAPEMAACQGVTTAVAGSIPAHPQGQITYFAVWANQGDSPLAASQSQPVLIGKSEVVWPPSAMTVNVTPDKAVAASWLAPAGSRVEVQRFAAGQRVVYDQARLLPPESVMSAGFLDREAPQGSGLVYAAFCVAELPKGGSAISEPITVEVLVTPDAQQVRLDVKRSSSVPGAYDLTWMPPKNGQVMLYATKERPPQGLEKEPRSMEILQGEGLKPQFQITHPAYDLGGLHMIQGFAVDASWVRTHFVAVHKVTEELAWMGPPVSMVTPRPPEHAEVIERVNAQILTFPWPKGVSIIEAYQSPLGMDLDPEQNHPITSLTREEYDKTGGMRITRTLPSNGCSLHLFGVVYSDGVPVYSQGTSVDYRGITRLQYELVPMLSNGQKAPMGAAPSYYRLFATADDELHEVPIVLVGNPSRLPLEPGDGILVQEAVVSLPASQRVVVGDLPVGQRPLWMRLFINRPAAETGTIAVLDPHVKTLRMWV